MKTVLQECNGLKFPLALYATLAAVVSAAGKAPDGSIDTAKGETLTLDMVNKSLYYHGAATEARALMADAVEVATGVPREQTPRMRDVKRKDANGVETTTTEQAKDKDGNVLTDPVLDDTKYVKSALAKVIAAGGTMAEIQARVSEWFAALKDDSGQPYIVSVDISETPPRKTSAAKKLAAKHLELADKAIANGKVQGLLADFKKMSTINFTLPNAAAFDPANREHVGWLAKGWLEAREAATIGKAFGV